MKKIFVTLALALLTLSVSAAKPKKQKAPIKPMKEFVDDLMSRMTLAEKLGQLNLQVAGDITTGSAQDTEVAGLIGEGKMGGIFNLKGVDKIKALQQIAVEKSRLGIPLIVGMDVIHGYETIFPIPLGLSCSWDIDGIERAARIAAIEASADGINWFYSPMVDICVDARWGRVSEGNGEDPYLGSQIARALIRGYQGTENTYKEKNNVMACLKHFALYGAVEAGRDYNTVDMSHIRMYNQYFPPYRAAVEEGTGSIMSSFNLVDGEHATANRWLLNDVLRGQWGFNGFVVTDYASIAEMQIHGFGDGKQNAAKALRAGTDMDMCATLFLNTLEASLNDGTVSQAEIDQACRRVLEAKYKLGLFEDPYKYLDPKRRAKDIFTPANREEARRMAAETFVMLKNSRSTLPLSLEGSKKIALIGPLANDRANLAGTWCVAMTPERYSTVLEGMQNAVKGTGIEVLYAQGSNICRDEAQQKAAEFGKNIPRVDDAKAHAEAMEIAKNADVIVCAMGECADYSGESSSRADLVLPDVQMELLKDLCTLGKPVVLLNFAGRPTVLTWEQEHCDAILNVWFGGSETADAICDVLFGKVSPSGKLTMTMPQAVGQVPIYYNHLNTGRPVEEGAREYRKYASNYIDVRNDPLYPFGYGLSYTTFKYGKLKVEGSGDHFHAQVDVTNTGSIDADEIVQLYIHDVASTLARPVKELKGFERVSLKAGETRTVTFEIGREALSYYNAVGELVFEPGEFDIMVGPNSRDVQSQRVK